MPAVPSPTPPNKAIAASGGVTLGSALAVLTLVFWPDATATQAIALTTVFNIIFAPLAAWTARMEGGT